MELKMSHYGNPSTTPPTQASGRTRIVVPVGVGDRALDTLRQLFINAAGGCTETAGKGYWHAFEGGKYASEPLAIFDVAGLPMAAVTRAAEIIIEAGQTDVYVELASGNVIWFNEAEPNQPKAFE